MNPVQPAGFNSILKRYGLTRAKIPCPHGGEFF